MKILEVIDVAKKFGELKAVDGCSFHIREREIVGLIGPNGAGKTTLFNIITGILKGDRGKIHFKGNDITDLKPFQIAQAGIGRTYQIVRIFPKMTLLENLVVAASGQRRKEERGLELLEFVGLLEKENELASDLSFGQQKLLSLVQCLMFDARLILLDEPTAGVNPTLQNRILDLIHQLRDDGKTFLIVEHDMDVIMGHCSRIIALHRGKKLAEGKSDEIKNNEEILTAYFGE